jgi:hypothetical protein
MYTLRALGLKEEEEENDVLVDPLPEGWHPETHNANGTKYGRIPSSGPLGMGGGSFGPIRPVQPDGPGAPAHRDGTGNAGRRHIYPSASTHTRAQLGLERRCSGGGKLLPIM